MLCYGRCRFCHYSSWPATSTEWYEDHLQSVKTVFNNRERSSSWLRRTNPLVKCEEHVSEFRHPTSWKWWRYFGESGSFTTELLRPNHIFFYKEYHWGQCNWIVMHKSVPCKLRGHWGYNLFDCWWVMCAWGPVTRTWKTPCWGWTVSSNPHWDMIWREAWKGHSERGRLDTDMFRFCANNVSFSIFDTKPHHRELKFVRMMLPCCKCTSRNCANPMKCRVCHRPGGTQAWAPGMCP